MRVFILLNLSFFYLFVFSKAFFNAARSENQFWNVYFQLIRQQFKLPPHGFAFVMIFSFTVTVEPEPIIPTPEILVKPITPDPLRSKSPGFEESGSRSKEERLGNRATALEEILSIQEFASPELKMEIKKGLL